MTPHDAHAEHADIDVLADVLVGEASPEQAAHVTGCASCRGQLAALEAALTPLTADLSALAAAELAEPADLQARLEAALTAERTAAGADPTPTPAARPAATPAATVTPINQARSRRWVAASSGVAAAAVLVVGAVFLAGGTGQDDRSTSAADAGAGSSIATSSTGVDYAEDGVLLREQLPALLAGGAPAVESMATLQVPATADGQPAPSGPASDTGAPGTTTEKAVDPLAALREPATLAACLAGLTDPGDDSLPLALDYATFKGQPALVVVLPTTKAGKVDVYVVGAGCSAADATLLFFTRLDAPPS